MSEQTFFAFGRVTRPLGRSIREWLKPGTAQTLGLLGAGSLAQWRVRAVSEARRRDSQSAGRQIVARVGNPHCRGRYNGLPLRPPRSKSHTRTYGACLSNQGLLSTGLAKTGQPAAAGILSPGIVPLRRRSWAVQIAAGQR